ELVAPLGAQPTLAKRLFVAASEAFGPLPFDARGDWLRAESAATSDHPGGFHGSLSSADYCLPLFVHAGHSLLNSAIPLVSFLRGHRLGGDPDPNTGRDLPSSPGRPDCDSARLVHRKVHEDRLRPNP